MMVELAIRWSQQLVSLALQVLAWAGLSSVTAAGQVLKFLRNITLIVSKNYAFVLSLLRLVVLACSFNKIARCASNTPIQGRCLFSSTDQSSG